MAVFTSAIKNKYFEEWDQEKSKMGNKYKSEDLEHEGGANSERPIISKSDGAHPDSFDSIGNENRNLIKKNKSGDSPQNDPILKTLESRKNFYSFEIIENIERNVSFSNIYKLQDSQELTCKKMDILKA